MTGRGDILILIVTLERGKQVNGTESLIDDIDKYLSRLGNTTKDLIREVQIYSHLFQAVNIAEEFIHDTRPQYLVDGIFLRMILTQCGYIIPEYVCSLQWFYNNYAVAQSRTLLHLIECNVSNDSDTKSLKICLDTERCLGLKALTSAPVQPKFPHVIGYSLRVFQISSLDLTGRIFHPSN